MQRGAFGLHVHLNDLLGIVPSATGIGHKHSLEESEDGNADEVGDEEADGVVATDAGRGGEAGKSQREAEDGDEDVYHALLSVVGADLHHFLALLDVSLLGGIGVELDIVFDVLHSAVGTGGDSLHRSTREPVYDAATEDESEDAVGVEHVENGRGFDTKGLLYHQDEAEDHRGGTHNGSTDEHGLGSGLEGVAGAVVGFQIVFCLLEVGLEAELALNLLGGLLDVVLDEAKLIDALGVVGHRTVAVDGDSHGTHAEHTEGHEAEGEDAVVGTEDRLDAEECGGEVGNDHQHEEHHAGPEAAHVAGYQAAEDVQRCATLLRGFDHLFHMLRRGRGEQLGELGEKSCTKGAAADDDAQCEPQVGHTLDVAEDEVACAEGTDDAHDGGNPHQARQRLLEVDVVGLVVAGFCDSAVNIIGKDRGNDTEYAHHENPHQQLHLHGGVGNC